jgi:hypothetical protein
MKLSKEILEFISQSAEEMDYGDITIHIVDTSRVVDIEVNNRVRFEKASPPRAGEIAPNKRFVIRATREDAK